MWKKYSIYFGIAIGIVLTIIIIQIIPFISNLVSNWGAAEILVAITLVGVVINFTVPFIHKKINFKNITQVKINKEERCFFRIEIHVKTLPNNTVVFSASMENVGDKTITPQVSNLYIDQGIKTKKENKAWFYKFPFILQHNLPEGQPDCILCTKCKGGVNMQKDFNYPTESIDSEFKDSPLNLYRTNILLEHLSEKSIKYIHPKEKFSEDVVMQFESGGVYRVTFFCLTTEADCQCATKQFVVPEIITEIKETQTINKKGGTK
jgi:hypothetical protein